jgi:ABC-2 type transport system ATP-binding protein
MSESTLRAAALTQRYGEFLALDGLSIDIPKGKIVGVLGPSGSGKTTLLRCLANLQKPSSGTVEWIGSAPGARTAAGRTKGIGYMAQSDALYDDLNGRENLAYFAGLQGISGIERKRRIDAVLALTLLAPDARKLVRHYSGGMKKRLSLAAALVHDPDFLILDEPTVGIDPLLRASFWQEFARLRGLGKTILLSTHAMDEAERCDLIALIFDGRLLAYASPKEVMEKLGAASVEAAFIKLREGMPNA